MTTANTTERTLSLAEQGRVDRYNDALDKHSDQHDTHDVDGFAFDRSNNNATEEDFEDYRHDNIVRQSIVNGQFKQAKQQATDYGLDYSELYKEVSE